MAGAGSTAPVARMMWVSLVTALVITFGKIAISLLSAFAVVYFRFPFKSLCFWAIFITATIARVPLAAVFREITPFTLIMLLVVLLLTYVPFLSLWLPNLIGKF